MAINNHLIYCVLYVCICMYFDGEGVSTLTAQATVGPLQLLHLGYTGNILSSVHRYDLGVRIEVQLSKASIPKTPGQSDADKRRRVRILPQGTPWLSLHNRVIVIN